MSYVDQGSTVAAFDQAAFSVPLNTISDPIRTQEFGYHIIKVLDRRPAGYRSFEEVRPQIASQLSDQASKDRARDAVTAIAARIREAKPKTPEDFSKFATDIVSSNDTLWFGKSDSLPGIGNNPALTSWAFAAKEGDVSDVMGTQRGPAIAYLYSIRKAGMTAETEIRAKVEADARNAKARDVAKQELAKSLPAATVDEAAKKLGVNTVEATVTRQGFISGFSGDTAPLVDAAMAAHVGELKGPIVLNEGAVVFQVLEQKKVDQKEANQNKASYAEMMRQQEARSLRTVLLQRLRKDAKVDVNQNLIQSQKSPQQQAGL